jgi:pyridoxal phosphate enzyme (YggS family)
MTTTEIQQRIRDNFFAVTDDVAAAAKKADRSPDEVKIIGVTKYVDAATTAALVDAGCHTLGENRPQVMWSKAESAELAGKPIQWHMIGHLQRNKLRRLMRLDPLIHSVDSVRLFDAISKEAVANEKSIEILLEVNISGDESKTGMSTDELQAILEKSDRSTVRINGLMAMAGLGTDQGTAQKQFAAVRQLRDSLSSSTGNPLPELSMGMSGDFAEAIAEGATMVRIGSRLFDGVR